MGNCPEVGAPFLFGVVSGVGFLWAVWVASGVVSGYLQRRRSR